MNKDHSMDSPNTFSVIRAVVIVASVASVASVVGVVVGVQRSPHLFQRLPTGSRVDKEQCYT